MTAKELTILLKNYKLPKDLITYLVTRAKSPQSEKIREQRHIIKQLRHKISLSQYDLEMARVTEHRHMKYAQQRFIQVLHRTHISEDKWHEIIAGYMNGYKLPYLHLKYGVSRPLMMRLLQVDYRYDEHNHTYSKNGHTIQRKPIRDIDKPIAKKHDEPIERKSSAVNTEPHMSLEDDIKAHMSNNSYNNNVVIRHVKH